MTRIGWFSAVLLLSVVSTCRDSAGSEFPGVIPTPKQIELPGRVLPLSVRQLRGSIAIAVSREPTRPERQAISELRECLSQLAVKAIEIGPVGGLKGADSALIAVGVPAENADLARLCGAQKMAVTASSPGPEGYELKAFSERGRTRVLCAGSDPMGAYYGVQTLRQLLVRTDQGVGVREATIRDRPTFRFRSFKGQCWYYKDDRHLLAWAPRLKWNRFGPCYTNCPQWRDPPKEYQKLIGDLCLAAKESGVINVVQLGNPYMARNDAIRASAEGDVDQLVDFFRLSLDGGGTELMLCLDDFAYLPKQDSSRFGNLAAANSHIVSQFHSKVRALSPRARILLCPPPYWLPTKQEQRQYLIDLGKSIPKDVAIVWTGKVVTTVRHEEKDILAYQKLIGEDRGLFLWDNTLKVPPGWSNVFKMNAFLIACKDLAASAWPSMAKYTNGEAVINTYGPAEIYKVPLATAADYLWNPEAYDPEQSFRKALYHFDPDPRVGELLAEFVNEQHAVLSQLRKRFLRSPATLHRELLDQIANLTREYQRTYKEIGTRTQNKRLIATLRPYLDRHVRTLPILEEVLRAAEGTSDHERAGKLLREACREFDEVSKLLAKGPLTSQTDGCVRTNLERETKGALQALRAKLIIAEMPARGKLTLSGDAFAGGGRPLYGGLAIAGSKTCNWVYAKPARGASRMEARVRLSKVPTGGLRLTLHVCTLSHDRKPIMTAVQVNKEGVHKEALGPFEESYRPVVLTVPGEALQTGVNVISVANLEPSGRIGWRPWVAVDRVEIVAVDAAEQ